MDKELNFCEVTRARKFYPSVECGPINSAKAKRVLEVPMTPIVNFKHNSLGNRYHLDGLVLRKYQAPSVRFGK